MSDPGLDAALEAALVRELRAFYERHNHRHFGGRLVPPVLVLSDTTQRLGRWVQATRTLEVSRALVLARPWLEVTSVLEHEMAHQYVDEVLRVREAPHGEMFQRVCAERGIDARAAGAPVASAAGGEPDRVLERIRRLLALAASENLHEAELAMRRAHELMLRHNIEQAAARAVQRYEVRHLGTPRRRADPVEAEIMGLLSEHFFVEVIRVPVYMPTTGNHGDVYEVIGTYQNVEMAEHVHAFLLATAARLWRENRGDARVKSGRDRVAYQCGVIGGFREKLALGRQQHRKEGLVWVGDGGLDRFFRARYPRISRRRRSISVTAAHHAGREAGRKIVLHKPVTRGPSGGGTRLVGDGS